MSIVATLVTSILAPKQKRILRKPNKSPELKTGPDQVCKCCGELKPRHKFATGVTGKPAKTCYTCYRNGAALMESDK